MTVPTPNSIKFIPTKVLINELFDRFDSAIFVGNQQNRKDHSALGWDVKGDYFSLVGLNIWLAHRLNEMEPQDPNGVPDEI